MRAEREFVETEIVDDPAAVAAALKDIGLSVAGVLAVRDIALARFRDVGPFMPANAAGTMAYHHGVEAMRMQFVGDHYRMDRTGGIESIISQDGKRKVVFQNVDVASSKTMEPSPRSEKGSGLEQACTLNLFEALGVKLPRQVRQDNGVSAVFFIMVDDRGAVEVSRPVLKDGGFAGLVQRILVSDGTDLEVEIKSKPLAAPAEDFNVSVKRKQ